MNEEVIIKLQNIIEELELIFDSQLPDGHANDFIELLESEKDILVRGNSEGLIHIATCLLQLAESRIEGKHYHLEKGCPFDKCEKNLIISYKSAEWE